MTDACDAESFYENGYSIIKSCIDESLINDYLELWHKVNNDRPEGWSKLKSFTRSFNDYSEILNILCSKRISSFFECIGKDPVLHADITYSVSTQLNWHQDNTSSSEDLSDTYFGSWVALEDIHPDSGPISYIPGSHLWDMDYENIDPKNIEDKDVVKFNSERLDYYKSQIDLREAEEKFFTAQKGDVLMWHGKLLHRGSTPNDFSLTRMSLIGHYSEYKGPVKRHNNGTLYAID